MEPVNNLTVPLGRDAIFTCYVTRLGGHKVKDDDCDASGARSVVAAAGLCHMRAASGPYEPADCLFDVPVFVSASVCVRWRQRNEFWVRVNCPC